MSDCENAFITLFVSGDWRTGFPLSIHAALSSGSSALSISDPSFAIEIDPPEWAYHLQDQGNMIKVP